MNFAAMLRAIQGDCDTNIIATPSAITMDNQEAELKVAQEVPFITGQFTNTGGDNNGSVNPFQTVQREEVGTILKVTPQINATAATRCMLKIELESSSLAASSRRRGRPHHQQAHGQHQRADRGRRHRRARRPDPGQLARAASSACPILGRIPLIGACVQDAQPQTRQDQPHGVHPAEDPARRRADRDRDQREVQLHARRAAEGQRSASCCRCCRA